MRERRENKTDIDLLFPSFSFIGFLFLNFILIYFYFLKFLNEHTLLM